MKIKSKVLFNAFIESAVDAHVGWMLYESELPKTLLKDGKRQHRLEISECQVPACKARWEIIEALQDG